MNIRSIAFAVTTGFVILSSAQAQPAGGAAPNVQHAPKLGVVRAVYHITTSIDSAAAALNNVSNHLNADPKAKIVVVTNGPGIDFMIQDNKDSKGREFSSAVADLAGRGVEFRVCNNTLVTRNIPADKLLMEAKVVPSGVAEAAQLQFREGYAYIKP